MQVTLTNFKHTEHLPSQVYALPATGNMEYGFFSSKQLVSGCLALTMTARTIQELQGRACAVWRVVHMAAALCKAYS